MRAEAVLIAMACGGCSIFNSPTGNEAPPDLAGDFSSRDLATPADLRLRLDLSPFDPDAGSCTVVPQSGCGPGEKCGVIGSVAGCEQAGTVPIGGSCGAGSIDDCVTGSICTSTAGAPGICRQACATDGDCTPATTGLARCTLMLSNYPISVCSIGCNPVSNAGVTGCNPTSPNCAYGTQPKEETDCTTAGPGADGAPCASPTDCTVGFGCATDVGTTVAHCRQYCRANMSADCKIATYACNLAVGGSLFGFCQPGGG